MSKFRILLLFVSFIVATNANHVHLQTYMGTGLEEFWTCYDYYKDLTWGYPEDEFWGTIPATGAWGIYFGPFCNYPPAVGTLLLCSNELASKNSKTMDIIYKYLENTCAHYSKNGHHWKWYRNVFINSTENYENYYNIANISAPLYIPITTNMSAITDYKLGNEAYYFNLDLGTWFSVGIIGYFALLIIISALYRIIRSVGILKNLYKYKFIKFIQANIIISPLFKNGSYAESYGNHWFPILFPNRLQFLADLILFSLQIAFYCVPYKQNQGYFTTTPRAAWQRFLADRTGIMAFGKIPLLILFSGRNNFLIWVTGWSHSTFIHFHKVLGRYMFLDAIIHSIGYTIQSLGHYSSNLKEPYFASGVAATIFSGVIILFSINTIRRYYYEYFYVLHNIFSICFIITCWFHCNILGWLEWIIAACVVWFLNGIIRFVRMFSFGYRKVKVLIVDDDILKIEVSKPSWWKNFPGAYGYMYFSGPLFWENHPFTCILDGNNIISYIKVKKGLTYRLRSRVIRSNGVINTHVCVEGPYGGENNNVAKVYDEILFIAGGSGIVSLIQLALSVNKGKFIWIVKDIPSIMAFIDLIKKIDFDINIYVTRVSKNLDKEEIGKYSSSSQMDILYDNSDNELKELLTKHNLNIFYTKPVLENIVDDIVKNSNYKNLGIYTCGPSSMVDSVRNIVTNNLVHWDKSVDFIDKLEIW